MARGSKPGERRGGRKAGTPNRRTIAARALAGKAVAEGITPLEVMLIAMRAKYEQGDLEGASYHARDAAPYMHPKLTSVEATGKGGGPIDMLHRIERLIVGPADSDR